MRVATVLVTPRLDQANNKTNNRIVEYKGQRMTLSQMIRVKAKDEGLPVSTVRRRVERELYKRT